MITEMEIVPIWSSLGNRSVKVVVKTENGIFSSSSPIFSDNGKYCPADLEVGQAVKKFHDIKKEFIGMDEHNYDIIDDKIKKIGYGNIGAGVSACISKACVKAGGKGNGYRLLNNEAFEFPLPMAPVISGGIHGGYSSIQNFFVISRARTLYDCINDNYSFWKDIGKLMKDRGVILGRSSEGSWISNFTDLKTLDILSHYAGQKNMGLGIDFGGSRLYKKGRYVYEKIGQKFDAGEQIEFVREMVKKYNITYIQDPFQPNDFDAFVELKKKLQSTLIVGDELYSSQIVRLKKGISMKATTGAVVKIEKAGTVSAAIRFMDNCKDNGQVKIIGDRIEETEDEFLADLAVGSRAEIFRYGISGSERVSKINRLLEIWFDVAARKQPEMADVRI
jgi:enolase